MAKKKSINKTSLIQGALAEHPHATNAEIMEKLKKYGITAQYVSTVKSKMGTKKPKKKATKKVAKKAVSDKVSLGALVKASRLAEELGGVDKAQELLNALAKLK